MSITKLLGIKYPILQGGMAQIALAPLAAAPVAIIPVAAVKDNKVLFNFIY